MEHEKRGCVGNALTALTWWHTDGSNAIGEQRCHNGNLVTTAWHSSIAASF